MAISSNNLNYTHILQDMEEQIKGNKEQILCKGLLQPFNISSSGARKILFSTQANHIIPISSPEVPFVSTGYENRFGDLASCILSSGAECEVLHIVPKFSFAPRQIYYIIVKDKNSNIYRVFERTSYDHTTESYGYLYNNTYMDSLSVGDTIPQETIIRKSNSYDDYGNREDGVNILCAYLATDKTMEDSVIFSKSGAAKMGTSLISEVNIILNDNDIPLNLYGDYESGEYKSFPDIGEKIENGILCAIRRENREESLFTQSYAKLKEIMMSDDKFTREGIITDIDIKINNPALLEKFYNTQLGKYYMELKRFAQDLVNIRNEIITSNPDAQFDYELEKLFFNAGRILKGDQYTKDGKKFTNATLTITVLKNEPLGEGDKVSDRYGGKGVVSFILPDHLMPQTEHGEVVDAIINQSTCVNRLNPGQLFETSLTHIGSSICRYISTHILSPYESMDMLIEFTEIVCPEQAQSLRETKERYNEEELEYLIDSIIDDGMINLSLRPIMDNMTLDKLDLIYQRFPWIQQTQLIVPQEDSNGNIRYIPSRRKIICSKKYMFRLKQIAEDKFSSTSLSATNIKNQNTKSKNSKAYKSLHSNTPISMGTMEVDDLASLGQEYVITFLMIHSVSPEARRLCEEMLTGDPLDVDISLNSTATNRSVEILNTYLKSKGLKLVFSKKLREKKPLIKLMADTPFGAPIPLIKMVDEDENFNFDEYYERLAKVEEMRNKSLIQMPLAYSLDYEEDN